MKVWGVIAAVLIVISLGVSGWLYTQNQDLTAKLNSANSAKEAAEQSLSSLKENAGKKAEVLTIFFQHADDPGEILRAKDLIEEINDPTLLADWQALEQSGDEAAGTKFLTDIILAIAEDLGVRVD